jgi:hypothetical protein
MKRGIHSKKGNNMNIFLYRRKGGGMVANEPKVY